MGEGGATSTTYVTDPDGSGSGEASAQRGQAWEARQGRGLALTPSVYGESLMCFLPGAIEKLEGRGGGESVWVFDFPQSFLVWGVNDTRFECPFQLTP